MQNNLSPSWSWNIFDIMGQVITLVIAHSTLKGKMECLKSGPSWILWGSDNERSGRCQCDREMIGFNLISIVLVDFPVMSNPGLDLSEENHCWIAPLLAIPYIATYKTTYLLTCQPRWLDWTWSASDKSSFEQEETVVGRWEIIKNIATGQTPFN